MSYIFAYVHTQPGTYGITAFYANGASLGDTTTLADATVVDTIRTASASGKDD